MWLWKGCISLSDDADARSYQEPVLIADVDFIIPRRIKRI